MFWGNLFKGKAGPVKFDTPPRRGRSCVDSLLQPESPEKPEQIAEIEPEPVERLAYRLSVEADHCQREGEKEQRETGRSRQLREPVQSAQQRKMGRKKRDLAKRDENRHWPVASWEVIDQPHQNEDP